MSRNREFKYEDVTEQEAVDALENSIELALVDANEAPAGKVDEESATLVLAELTAAIWSTIQGLEFEALRLRRELAALGAESLAEKRVYH